MTMDAEADVSEVEREIARTRERMKEHLDDLVSGLAPTAIVDAAFPHITGVGGAQFADELIARIKGNPAAALLIVAGAIWLFGFKRVSS